MLPGGGGDGAGPSSLIIGQRLFIELDPPASS